MCPSLEAGQDPLMRAINRDSARGGISRAAVPAKPRIGLPARRSVTMLLTMFIVSEADAAAIRATFEQDGELSAAIEVRRLFPGIVDNPRRGRAPGPSPVGNRCPPRLVRLPRYAFVGAGLGRRSPDRTRACRQRCSAVTARQAKPTRPAISPRHRLPAMLTRPPTLERAPLSR